MYAYLMGKITKMTDDNHMILENNGIGYSINTSSTTLSSLPASDFEVKIFTYLHVREDIFSLYGFLTAEELQVFKLLISVSGVGPKAALGITSTLSPSKFSLSIITGDAKLLSTAPGIGKKTAERIILELKDKIKKEQGNFQRDSDPVSSEPQSENSIISEALEALLVLGYSKEIALNALIKHVTPDIEIEPLIKNALKSLSI
jgi:holliday junction DNA helicase RuvA